jgi:hypothetical protein
LFILTDGAKNFLDISQVAVSKAVMELGLVLPAECSHCVPTRASPTPGTAGFFGAFSVMGSWNIS